MRNSTPFLALAGLACVLAMGLPSGARPRVTPSPSPTPTAAPTDTPTAAPSPTPSPSPSASPSPSVTPYVRRYFNGRPIDTPPPTPTGSLTPTPVPTTTPYVRRYFQGRPIDTPPPTPTGSLTPTPIPTTTPYVRRYFQGRLIDTPPPTLTPPGLTSPSPSGSETPSALPSPQTPATTIPHRLQPTPLIRSDELLGDWDCTTFGGTHLTHEFSRADDAVSLEVTTTIVLPNGKTAMLHESYKHNPNTHVWTAVLAGGLIFAKGSDWTGDTWTLVGQTRESGAPTRFRMIFTALGTDAYRRDFQRPDGASWATYAGETCRRTQL
jgi:hypothetical protein